MSAAPARTGRPRGRSRTAVVLVACLASAGSLSLVAPAVSATGPQHLLQAVTVDLGTDGTVFGLAASDVRDRGDGAYSTQRVSYDPSKTATTLPFRVSLSYRAGGRSGTDLADLAGTDGPVEVDVTVENTTLHAERLGYDAAGAHHEQWAQVATPLTVVATASLAPGTFPQVVRAAPGTTSDTTTNGVVGTTTGGAATVQWSALLSPPRMPASTTFRLVMDAHHFALPHLDLTVQPGLVTDTSLPGLLDDAFGSGGRLAQTQNTTLALVSNVNATLAQATESLDAVRTSLSTGATTLGDAAKATLTQTAGGLDSTAQTLLGDLTALQGAVASTVTGTQTQASAALQDTLKAVTDYIGVPTDGVPTDGAPPGGVPTGSPTPPPTSAPLTAGAIDPIEPRPVAAPCGQLTQPTPATTLLGRLQQVSGQLRELAGSSAACVDTLRAGLEATIGDPAACAVRVDRSAPLVCRLDQSSAALRAVAQRLRSEGDQLVSAFDPTALTGVSAGIDGLVAAVRGLQDDAAALDPANAHGVTAQMTGRLAALRDRAQAALDAIAGSGASSGGLFGAAGDLHASAQAQLAQLGSSGSTTATGTTVADQIAAIAQQVCALPKGESGADARARADRLHGLIAGGPCPGSPARAPAGVPVGSRFPAPLAARIDAQAAAWQAVASATDMSTGAPVGMARQLSDLRDSLVALRNGAEAALGEMQQPAPGVQGGDVAVRLDALTAAAAGLYRAPGAPAGCSPLVAAPEPALNALQRQFDHLRCNQDGLQDRLKALLQDAQPQYAAAARGASDAADSVGQLRATADDQLGALLTALSGGLSATADSVQDDGTGLLTAQAAQLQERSAAALAGLDSAGRSALADFDRDLTTASGSQATAEEQLRDQLQKVLTDLGSGAAGQGLLGAVQASAGQTGVHAGQVADAAAATAGFLGARQAELAESLLEQRQVERALQAAQAFPAFGPPLPTGSTSTTAFSVVVRPVS